MTMTLASERLVIYMSDVLHPTRFDRLHLSTSVSLTVFNMIAGSHYLDLKAFAIY